jgi:hypothetical protein
MARLGRCSMPPIGRVLTAGKKRRSAPPPARMACIGRNTKTIRFSRRFPIARTNRCTTPAKPFFEMATPIASSMRVESMARTNTSPSTWPQNQQRINGPTKQKLASPVEQSAVIVRPYDFYLSPLVLVALLSLFRSTASSQPRMVYCGSPISLRSRTANSRSSNGLRPRSGRVWPRWCKSVP